MVRMASLLLLVCLGGCPDDRSRSELNQQIRPQARKSPRSVGRYDEIYSLLAYAIAYVGWTRYDRRGHNIAAVLVDDSDRVVCWARNAVTQTHDSTQHAEVRLISNYLRLYGSQMTASGGAKLNGYRIFTTLEPCSMCAGMMLLTRLDEVIFGQAVESLLGQAVKNRGGSLLKASPSDFLQKLDLGYRNASRSNGTPHQSRQAVALSVTRWLEGDSAKVIFRAATERLGKLRITDENETVLTAARRFLSKVASLGEMDPRLPYGEEHLCFPPTSVDDGKHL